MNKGKNRQTTAQQQQQQQDQSSNDVFAEMSAKKRTVFVTVGTTKFPKLVNLLLSDDILTCLRRNGIERMVMQVGDGKHEDAHISELGDSPVKFYKEGVEIHAYCYSPSLQTDLASADLVISHAGAGSIIESLEANKRLIVVVNEDLMDNHQFELARKMHSLNYLLYTTCGGLRDKIELVHNKEFSLAKYVPGNPKLFGDFLGSIFVPK
jgi:beta-1,4-N-acetylglucosaminyltransferase